MDKSEAPCAWDEDMPEPTTIPMEMEMSEATMGHNMPPASTDFEAVEGRMNDLYDEARNWLDGEKVENQGTADQISKLLNLVRSAKKETDEARKAEAKPFDDGKKEVQARYNPVLSRADHITQGCKAALAPWLEKIEVEKREKERKAREEADEKRRIAEEAMRQSKADDLAKREEAERLLKEAKKAETVANIASRDKAKSSGGVGRAVSLRTSYEPVLTDAKEAARHYWVHNQKELEAFFMELAQKDVRAGKRDIPGFQINEIKTAA